MLPTRGRIGPSNGGLILEVEGELTAADLFRAMTEPGPRIGTPPLKRVGHIHRRIAQLIAQGKSDDYIAAEVGRTPQRIRDLKVDPALSDLVIYFQDQVDETSIEEGQRLRAKLLDVADDALDEISERLEDPAKRAEIPIAELRQIVSMGADRTVAPPRTATPGQQVPTHITFKIGTRELAPQIENEPVVVDVTPDKVEG